MDTCAGEVLLKQLNTPALCIEDVRMPGGLHARGHGHDVAHICAVLDGEFVERGSAPTTLRPGLLRTSPAGDQHDLQFSRAGAHCLLILVGDNIAEGAPLPAARRFLPVPDGGLLIGIRRALHDAAASPLEIELLILELLACTSARSVRVAGSRQPPPWLLRVRDLVRGAPVAAQSTACLAAEAGLHPVYVARAFRRWFGCSLASYMRVIRLERARRLILESAQPLAAIAAETGFADQSHLTRLLRQRTGRTPAALRQAGAHQVADVQDI
jgi:AraC family transcriptional regulator